MFTTKNDLSEKTRSEIVQMLNDSLSLLLDLQLQSKQAHWNVKGPHFIGLHELFDKVYEAVTEYVDLVAERAVQLGGIAHGTVQAISKQTSLPPYPENISSGKDHLENLSQALSMAGKSIRNNIDKSEEAGDKGTADLYTEISQGLDEQLWFLEAHLQDDK